MVEKKKRKEAGNGRFWQKQFFVVLSTVNPNSCEKNNWVLRSKLFLFCFLLHQCSRGGSKQGPMLQNLFCCITSAVKLRIDFDTWLEECDEMVIPIIIQYLAIYNKAKVGTKVCQIQNKLSKMLPKVAPWSHRCRCSVSF